MRKITIVLLMAMAVGYSQNCKYEKNEVDEFTKNKILVVKGSEIFKTSMFTGLYFQISKINETKFITFSLTSGSVFVLEKGENKIMLKTKDEQIINIGFDETLVSEIVTGSIGIMCYCHQRVLLNDNLLYKLKNVEIIKVRIYTKDGYIEKEVKNKHSKNISQDLKCI